MKRDLDTWEKKNNKNTMNQEGKKTSEWTNMELRNVMNQRIPVNNETITPANKDFFSNLNLQQLWSQLPAVVV